MNNLKTLTSVDLSEPKMHHFYAICFLLSCLFVFLGCTTEPDIDNKLVIISDADTPPDEVIL